MEQQKIKEIFEYKEGKLYWKINPSFNVKQGDEAGTTTYEGYRAIRINKKQYRVHRLIFCLFNGFMPSKVDHIDGNPSNNLIENLREADNCQNGYNRKLTRTNKLGIKGVHEYNGRYIAQVQVNKKKVYLGTFLDLELAELVAIEARNKYHKEFSK